MLFITSGANQPGGKIAYTFKCFVHGLFELTPDGRVLPKPETMQ